MNKKSDRRIATAVCVIDQQREILRRTDATFAVQLLDIALLELRRQLYGISEDELHQLVSLVEGQAVNARTDLQIAGTVLANTIKLPAETN
jgi:hypothetical protein